MSVAAFALASPAVFAQSQGAGVGVDASAAARVPTQVPAQAQMQDAQCAEPQKAPPGTPATPAQPAAQEGKKDGSALDTDGNGSLSVAEAASLDSLAKVFAQADVDGNGELTGEEYKVWWTANAAAKAGKR